MPTPHPSLPRNAEGLRRCVALALLAIVLGSCATTVPGPSSGTAEESFERPMARPGRERRGRALVGVPFASNQWGLTPQARAVLDRLASNGADEKGSYLEIHGFCDPGTSGRGGAVLAHKRAQAVRSYLHQRDGIDLGRIGERTPSTCAPPPSSGVPSPRGSEVIGAVIVVLAAPPR